MKILLVIASMGAGGAERVIALLANEFARRGNDVTVATLASTERDFFEVVPEVKRMSLGGLSRSRNWVERVGSNLIRVARLRQVVREVQPAVTVSFITETNVLLIIACAGLRTTLIVSERTDPDAHDPGRVWAWLRRMTYSHADALVVQTESIASWFRAAFGRVPPIAVIPNPVAQPPASLRPVSDGAGPYLFAAGRLGREKGFDLMIRALALLVGQGEEYQLIIAGEGPERRALQELAGALGVASRVRLIGYSPDVFSLMAGSFAFVLPSRYEGFPNVLLEALACGAPTIATDCRSGPREILGNSRDGLLVPPEDATALADAIRRLGKDQSLRKRLIQSGPSVAARFGIQAIADIWQGLFNGLQRK